MNDRQKILIGAAIIIIILLLLVGAYAMNGSKNNTTATPTPTPIPTSTPTPLPQGGSIVPTATPVPVVTPTSTPVPTLAPTPTPNAGGMGVETQNNGWPLYNYTWVAQPQITSGPVTVGFVYYEGYGDENYWINEGVNYYRYQWGEEDPWIDGGMTIADGIITLNVPVFRSGDLSGYTTVGVNGISIDDDGNTGIISISPAVFNPTDTMSNVTIQLDESAFTSEDSSAAWCDLELTINDSASYSIQQGEDQTMVWIND